MLPINNGDTLNCSEIKPCPKGYECVRSGKLPYCCPSSGNRV
ncbi:unnamed protein product [Enterobius vermicularis]|uniref:CC domain-containing protein n=1 Tax=Enterobius vermicularis TaxID=51028 RepID=A0A0N4VBJ4_ENTVE|nr:unnamed protein product [Enterobius vermicularis]